MPDWQEMDLEQNPSDALVSWWLTGEPPYPAYAGPGLPDRQYHFDQIVHLVRDPLEVVKSVPSLRNTSFDYIDRELKLPVTVQENPLRYSALFWLRWNELADRKADVRLRVEEQDARSLCLACGLDVPKCSTDAGNMTASADTNTRVSFDAYVQNVTAHSIADALSESEASEFFALARKYGYHH
jgi:hypothetical protein